VTVRLAYRDGVTCRRQRTVMIRRSWRSDGAYRQPSLSWPSGRRPWLLRAARRGAGWSNRHDLAIVWCALGVPAKPLRIALTTRELPNFMAGAGSPLFVQQAVAALVPPIGRSRVHGRYEERL